MTVKRWLFVDYENIPTLEYLEPKRYERLIVFIGPTQHSIKLPRAGQHGLMTLQVVQIRNQGKNSLDFHLAYYLGLLEAEAASSVEFEVLSLDKGFAPLIEYISAGGRVCRQLKMPQPGGPKKAAQSNKQSSAQNDEDAHLYNEITGRPRPKTDLKLVNVIASRLKMPPSSERTRKARAVLSRWVAAGVCSIDDSGKVTYLGLQDGVSRVN